MMNEPRRSIGLFLDGPFGPTERIKAVSMYGSLSNMLILHKPSMVLNHTTYVGIPLIVPSYGMTVRVLLYRKQVKGEINSAGQSNT